MIVRVTDPFVVDGPSGRGLRFALTLVFDAAETFLWTCKGCMAWRDRHNKLCFLTPVMYLGKKRIKYRTNVVSPALQRMIEDGLEREYGHKIQRRTPPWVAAGTPAADEGLPESMEWKL